MPFSSGARMPGVGHDPLPANDRDDVLPPTPGELFFRYARHAGVLALGLSLLIHLAGWVTSGMVNVRFGIGGRGPGPSGEVELATVSEAELDQLQAGAIDVKTPTVPDALSGENSVSVSDLTDAPIGDDMSASIGEISDVGSISGGGDVGSLGTGISGGGGGGGGGARFFGVEARGNRFAFIVDVSGSMGMGDKLTDLKREMIDAVGGLLETAQYLIVPYSSDAMPFGGKPEWHDASSSGKKWARDQINALNADGATIPAPAFEMVFGVRPRPDAIYFMTDGEFDTNLVEQIALLNKTSKVTIHCICFTTKESEEMMKKIAKQSGGTYTFVPGN